MAPFQPTVCDRRIDAAVDGIQVVRPVVQPPSAVSGFFSSLSNLFSFTPQRTLGYAALMIVLAFGVIFGLMKLNGKSDTSDSAKSVEQASPGVVATAGTSEKSGSGSVIAPIPVGVELLQRQSRSGNRPVVAKSVAPKAAPVRLLPGEKAYLQTIAKLDTAIKSEKKDMRPALQVEYERNLAVVDRAIAATRDTAKKNPSDPDAADFMFAAYQSKVDLLEYDC